MKLNEIACNHLLLNGIKDVHFARCCGIEPGRCSKWLNGVIDHLTPIQEEKVHDFLAGKYYMTADEMLRAAKMRKTMDELPYEFD